MDFLVYPTVICFPHAVLQQNALTVRHGDWNLSMVSHHTRAALGALELPWLSTALGKLNSNGSGSLVLLGLDPAALRVAAVVWDVPDHR